MIIDPKSANYFWKESEPNKKKDYPMIYKKFIEAWKNKDIEAYLDCYHEDWQLDGYR